ncbi:tetratricopeptide repeat protein [Qipengyuania sp. DGS5-3]|uniref:tetratricopeptide repeat protein n=1 Tax=Qipengyuania sp. DGS5-3 TaxID=3349632 RepID=UPI0036D3A131
MAKEPTIPTAAEREEAAARRKAAEEEALLREVDEAVRQGDLQSFADNYGKQTVAAIVLLLAAFGGFLFWQNQQDGAREVDSETLVGALDQVNAGNLQTGFDQLETLAGEDKGAASANAQMLRAGIASQEGRTDEAVAAFAELADNEKAPAELRDLARIREVAAGFDTMDPADVVAKLKPLAAPGNPFFGSAGELVAMAYLEQGNNDEAGALFAQIAKEESTPESLKSRARQMASLLGVDAIEDVDALLEEQGVTEGDTPAAQGGE